MTVYSKHIFIKNNNNNNNNKHKSNKNEKKNNKKTQPCQYHRADYWAGAT